MASTVLDPVAETLAQFITDLDVDVNVTGIKWERQAIDAQLPVGIVAPPTIHRTEPGDRETQMGFDDWDLEYPVGLYFELTDAYTTQTQAVEVVEKFIRAVDEDPSLGDPTIVDDAVVAEAEPEIVEDASRAVLVYRCRLLVNKGVPSP